MTAEKSSLSGLKRAHSVLVRTLTDERLRLWWLLCALYLGVSTLTRVVLAGVAITQGQLGTGNVPAMMAVGLLFDIVTTLNLFALFVLYLVVIPRRIYDSRWHRW